MAATSKKTTYTEAVGRRKTSVARVRLTKAPKTDYVVNEKPLHAYFPTEELRMTIRDAFEKSGASEKFKVSARIEGGGIHAQAEALRHGIARALAAFDDNTRRGLKKAGFLKRDARAKERRKFGLKKARRAPQWAKR